MILVALFAVMLCVGRLRARSLDQQVADGVDTFCVP
jgi:hypothetical protein